VLRVSLDAGSQLNRLQDTYQAASRADELAVAVGLKKMKDNQKELNDERGWLTVWEPMVRDLGMQGMAILADSHAIDQYVDETSNHLLVLKRGINTPVTYWAGFAWDRAGRITSAGAWSKYVDQFRERLKSPIAVTVK
jgi:hypothetical protein